MEFKVFERLMKYKSDKIAAWEPSKSHTRDAHEDGMKSDVQKVASLAVTAIGSTNAEARDSSTEDQDHSDEEPFEDALESLELHGECKSR